MRTHDYINNIKTTLVALNLKRYLCDMEDSHDNPEISENFYLELIILAHGEDLFKLSENSPYYILTELHLIRTLKIIHGHPDCAVTELTPLGHLFTDRLTNIKKVSDKTFAQYHQALDDQYHAASGALVTVCYLIMTIMGLQWLSSARSLLLKILTILILVVGTIIWIAVLRHVFHATNPANLNASYEHLCEFVCSDAFDSIADPYRPYVHQISFVKLIAQHPDLYISNIDLSMQLLVKMLHGKMFNNRELN